MYLNNHCVDQGLIRADFIALLHNVFSVSSFHGHAIIYYC